MPPRLALGFIFIIDIQKTSLYVAIMKKECPMKRILLAIVCIFLIPAVFAEAGMAEKMPH